MKICLEKPRAQCKNIPVRVNVRGRRKNEKKVFLEWKEVQSAEQANELCQ